MGNVIECRLYIDMGEEDNYPETMNELSDFFEGESSDADGKVLPFVDERVAIPANTAFNWYLLDNSDTEFWAQFDTFHHPPVAFMKILARKCPSWKIVLRYEDEGYCRMGVIVSHYDSPSIHDKEIDW